jgi:branched-chain amino acid transport system ATP-binding protein
MRDPLLVVEGLNAWYGRARILQGTTMAVGAEPAAVIGRNGMGKSTLCKAIMGMLSRIEGSIRFEGEELVGKPSHRIAGRGIGYVPQGHRLFPSLTVDEHLRLLDRGGGPWNRAAVYELFPHLAQRRSIAAPRLSGGEQQMLAIGRALLRNPRLLIMDEPSEGLAHAIVAKLVDLCRGLIARGVGILLVERNLRVAAALCPRQLVMISGRIEVEIRSEALLADPGAQQRYLGVTRVEAAAATQPAPREPGG